MNTLINRIKIAYAVAPHWLFFTCAFIDVCGILAILYVLGVGVMKLMN